MTSKDREKMIQEINDAKLSRKKTRGILIGLSLIPNLSTQLRFKAMLHAMDKADYENGKISKNTLAVKSILRFIPIGGLATAAFDIGVDMFSEVESFSIENLNEMTDEELKMLYEQVKEA